MSSKNIKLKESTFPLCYRSAEKIVQSTKSYLNRRRNESYKSLEKTIREHAIGKLGECAICTMAHLEGLSYTKPDFEVTYRKTFEKDLVVNGKKIHVKCQPKDSLNFTMKLRGTPSWSCEKNDKLVTHPDENDYIALLGEVSTTEIKFYGIIKAKDLKGYWKPAISQRLTTKACLYLNDFKDKMILDL